MSSLCFGTWLNFTPRYPSGHRTRSKALQPHKRVWNTAALRLRFLGMFFTEHLMTLYNLGQLPRWVKFGKRCPAWRTLLAPHSSVEHRWRTSTVTVYWPLVCFSLTTVTGEEKPNEYCEVPRNTCSPSLKCAPSSQASVEPSSSPMPARLQRASRQELRSASFPLCWRRTDARRGTAPSLRNLSCCKSDE